MSLEASRPELCRAAAACLGFGIFYAIANVDASFGSIVAGGLQVRPPVPTRAG